jgi:starch-binding outer membrane protein, SusD/RagB family
MAKKNIYIIAAFLTLLVTDCKKEFLEFNPVDARNTTSFYKTMEDAEMAVTAAYSNFNYVSAWDLDYIELSDIASDDAEAGGAFVNEVPAMEEINRLIPLTTNGDIAQAYGAMFKGISLSNLAIEKLPAVKETDPSADSKLIDQYIGECKFIRAISFAYLARFYGPVPLVNKVLTSSEFVMGQSPLIDIYEQIEKDLKEAIELLPEKTSYSGADIGRASKGAAKALLSRVLLYESSYARNYADDERFSGMTQRWQEALDYSEQVINSGLYILPGINGETFVTWRGPKTNGYRYEFTTNGDNSTESVFEIQCIRDGQSFVAARGSAFAAFSVARNVYKKGVSSGTGYWGLDLPTRSLVNEFETDGIYVDPRLHTGIAIDGFNDTLQLIGGWFPISYAMSVTGTYLRKYEVSAEEYLNGFKDWDTSPLNVRLIRYSEVLLNAAEAAVMIGDKTKAVTYLNEVRKRARMCGAPGNTVPRNYIEDDLTGTPAGMDQVIHERRCELFCEGFRYFDLVRWRLGEKYLGNTTTADGTTINYETPKHMFFPIPQRQIDISEDKLKQNPGW